jgi:hypothetical protein
MILLVNIIINKIIDKRNIKFLRIAYEINKEKKTFLKINYLHRNFRVYHQIYHTRLFLDL